MQQYFKALFRVFSFKFNLKKALVLVLVCILGYYALVIAHSRSTLDISALTAKLEYKSNPENDINNNNEKTDQNSTIKKNSETQEATGVKGCSIINKNHKQYSVNIDGIQYPQYLYLSQNKSINHECLNKSSPLKKILAWNKFYGERFMGYGAGPVKPFEDKNCPITNCEVIEDKKKLNEADLVVILMTDSIEENPPRTRTSPKERWVFSTIESPFYHPESYASWNGFFNYTSDYLSESEFGINYESQKRFLWALNSSFNESYDFHKDKSGFMVALISNCNAQNERLTYIKELRKYVSVEIYGSCGTPCPANVDCREYAGNKYKFFFAFENSNCKDYITEKFFLILKYNIIPVVVGGGNYSRFIPKSGYINAMDYPSPYHLAQYLKYLDSNVTAYNAYFKWKKHVNFLDKPVTYAFMCEMCIYLHMETYFGVKHKVINDFDSYWNRKTQCTTTSVSDKDSIKYFKFDNKI